MASTRSALASLKRLFTSVFSTVTSVIPTTTYVVTQHGTDDPKKILVANIIGYRVPDPTPIASDSTVDLTAVIGNAVSITGTTQISSFTLNDKQAVWVEFADAGGSLDGSSTIDVQGKTITWAAGDRAEIVDVGGGNTQVRQFVRKSGAQTAPLSFHCRVVSNANVTIATGLNNGDTVNGTVLATDDVVFLAYQTDASENGPYVVAASPARHPLFDTYDSLLGTLFEIDEGPTYGNAPSTWVANSAPGGTIDVDDVNFQLLVSNLGKQSNDGALARFIWFGLYLLAPASIYSVIVNIQGTYTASRQFILNLNDANRTLSLSGNLTVPGNATVSGTNTGDASSVPITRPVVENSADFTATVAESGTIYLINTNAEQMDIVLEAADSCEDGKTYWTFIIIEGSNDTSITTSPGDDLIVPFSGGHTTGISTSGYGFVTIRCMSSSGGKFAVEGIGGTWS